MTALLCSDTLLYYMIFVHCSKSAHAICQNRSRVFWLAGNNESFERVITIMHEKCAVLKMAASSRFAEVAQEEINQIIDDAIPKKHKEADKLEHRRL